MQKKQERLIEISSDGVVDEHEIRDFLKIQEELRSVSKNVESLKFWTEKEFKSR